MLDNITGGISFMSDMILANRAGKKNTTRRGRKRKFIAGHRYYVREKLLWATNELNVGTFYEVDRVPVIVDGVCLPWKYKLNVLPGMFMPEKLAREFIEVLSVHEEPLEAITEEGAIAEGFEAKDGLTARTHFMIKWNDINGKKPGMKFHDNPIVQVVHYKMITE